MTQLRLPNLRPELYAPCGEHVTILKLRAIINKTQAHFLVPVVLATATAAAVCTSPSRRRVLGYLTTQLIWKFVLLIFLAILYNQITLLIFYVRSISSSFREFTSLLAKRSDGEIDVPLLKSLLTCKEYRLGSTFQPEASSIAQSCCAKIRKRRQIPRDFVHGSDTSYSDKRIVTQTSTALIDFLITLLVPFLSVIYAAPQGRVSFHYSLLRNNTRRPEFAFCSIESVFRRYLAVVGGIARPVSCTDSYWIMDTPQNRCQIVGLAVIEDASDEPGRQLTLKELRELIISRLIPSDSKLSSVITEKFSRPIWSPLIIPHRSVWGDQYHQQTLMTDKSMIRKIAASRIPQVDREYIVANASPSTHLRKYQEHSTADTSTQRLPFGCFDIANHVYEIHIDSNTTTIHEAVSELASAPLITGAPPWRICLLRIHDHTRETTAGSNDETTPPLINRSASSTPTSEVFNSDTPIVQDENLYVDEDAKDTLIKTCVIFQCHHGLGDGVAIMYLLLKSFFDVGADISRANFPPVPVYKKAAFLGQQLLTTLLTFVPLIYHWTLSVAKPPPTFQRPSLKRCLSKQPSIEAETLRHPIRFKPIGVKYLSPPVLIPIADITQVRKEIVDILKDYCGLKPTLNDIMMCCITQAIEKLQRGAAYADLTSKFRSPHDTPSHRSMSSSRAAWNSSELVCRGQTPRLGSEIRDFSTPGADIRTHLDTYYEDTISFTNRNYSDVQILMPMSTRLGVPTKMDNNTATVMCHMPCPKASSRNTQNSRSAWPENLTASELQTLKHLKATKSALDKIKKSNIAWRWFLTSAIGAQLFSSSIINVSDLLINIIHLS